jgi:hypothetical protein
MRLSRPAEHRLTDRDVTIPGRASDRIQSDGASGSPRCVRALCGWSPPPLPADTTLKRRVDRILVGNAPTLVRLAVVIGLLNLAPRLPARPDLATVGVAALAAGVWCSLNFWRCHHAHCVVTGIGWLALSAFAFIESGLGHSIIGGDERPVFLGVLAAGLIFECCWSAAHHTNTISTPPT